MPVSKGRKKKSAPRRPKRSGLPADLRAMESVMADLHRAMPGGKADEAHYTAQDLVYQAWETQGAQRIRLARKALEVWPDCADAYVILAEAAATHEEKRKLYAAGVAAGERAVGRRAFKEDVGHFWWVFETRPYMRARAGLASVLWSTGETEEALAHLRDLLRLNPGDNQGVRYVLLGCLLELGRDDEAWELLHHPDYAADSLASWLYARALLTFKRQGDGPEAKTALADALESNLHLPAYLLGRKRMPEAPPRYITLGGESEAVSCAWEQSAAWHNAPGALDWLRSQS